jgi:ribosomal protein S18 acetylase RimI-like enzyme
MTNVDMWRAIRINLIIISMVWKMEEKALQIELRSLCPKDEPLLWDYLYLALFVPKGDPPLLRQIIHEPAIARYVANWGRRDDRGLLAVERGSGRDIGAAWLRLWRGVEPGYGFVDDDTPELSIVVRPEYRGQGIGTLLLQRVLADANSLYPAVSLSVSNANPAIRLYKRHGFKSMTSFGGSTTMLRSRG